MGGDGAEDELETSGSIGGGDPDREELSLRLFGPGIIRLVSNHFVAALRMSLSTCEVLCGSLAV